ncbi:hypothetical protein K9753_003237 [Escherichia coli]|nr:hypothetical protein [Escherichia coli]
MALTPPPDQWQKCRLRADLRQYDDFCRTLFCPEAVLFCQQQRLCHGPAGVRQLHCLLQVQFFSEF